MKSFSKIDKDQILNQYDEIEKLKAQIERMKCCQNCELYDCTSECKNKKCKYQYSEICREKTMIDKWELAE